MIDEAIREPEATERAQLVDVLAAAFRDNPMNVQIHGPNPARRIRANRAGLRSLVQDSTDDTLTRVLLREDGRVAGGFVAVPPGRFPLRAPRLRRLAGCFLHQGGRAMDRWSQVTSSLLSRHPLEPHWYLAVLGVAPSLQNRGLGGRLLDELFRAVEADPRSIHLESDRDASVRFYRSRGFEIVDELEPLGITCWCLRREIPGGTKILCDSVREA